MPPLITVYISPSTKALTIQKDMKKYREIDHNRMSRETFESKEYFYTLTLEDICLRFKISSHVVPSVRTSFPGKYRETGLRCPSCITVEETIPLETNHPVGRNSGNTSNPPVSNPTDTLNHIMLHCPTYGKFREGRNLKCDQQLVQFVRDVIQYRLENNQA